MGTKKPHTAVPQSRDKATVHKKSATQAVRKKPAKKVVHAEEPIYKQDAQLEEIGKKKVGDLLKDLF